MCIRDRDIPFLGSLRAMLNPERQKSNTVFAVIENDQLKIAVDAIERVVGDLTSKDTGIVFSLSLIHI